MRICWRVNKSEPVLCVCVCVCLKARLGLKRSLIANMFLNKIKYEKKVSVSLLVTIITLVNVEIANVKSY